jgi:DNA invertase Pin-like site-specific DNA recombinase
MTIAISYGRFSHASQAGGASRGRQEDDKPLAWCAANGYELDSKLFDEKRSAYATEDGETGEHRRGALGGFPDAIEKGRVPRGSALLIEALDRLSREEAIDALSLVTGIINKGVMIVTLEDDLRYSRQILRKQPHLIYTLIGKIQAAHDFSVRLSGRVLDGKAKSRADKLAAGLAVTRMCPAWLTVVDGRYAVLAERVAVIRMIFEWLAQDVSKQQVTHRLNEGGVPPFDRAGQGLTIRRPESNRGWHTSYVGKLVRNRALVGEFHPSAKSVCSKPAPASASAAVCCRNSIATPCCAYRPGFSTGKM